MQVLISNKNCVSLTEHALATQSCWIGFNLVYCRDTNNLLGSQVWVANSGFYFYFKF